MTETLKKLIEQNNRTAAWVVTKINEIDPDIKMTKSKLSRILSGNRQISVEELIAFCWSLDVSLDDFAALLYKPKFHHNKQPELKFDHTQINIFGKKFGDRDLIKAIILMPDQNYIIYDENAGDEYELKQNQIVSFNDFDLDKIVIATKKRPDR